MDVKVRALQNMDIFTVKDRYQIFCLRLPRVLTTGKYDYYGGR